MKGFACIGTLCRLHSSMRHDPFGFFSWALAGKPHGSRNGQISTA